ncbi:hypothetical protein OHA21_12105 [Actinoplanes sp. NBC_00393]|uniref:hypothetical protein n=1 Tax=Actinoplanes sp. NBC_00393 TaxID=2975953 RepID=UPI002E23AA77
MAARHRRLLSLFLAAATVMMSAVPAAAAPGPSGAPATPLTIHLDPGVSLPPGRYDVVLRGAGREFTATASVAPAAPAPAAPNENDSAGVSGFIVGALLLLLAGVAVPLVNLGLRQPRQRVSEYENLVRELAGGSYRSAVTGLTRIEGQLPERSRGRARFFIAYGLYRMADLDEAEHRLAALHREQPDDAQTAYLLAYLRVKRRDFDGAATILGALARAGRLDVAQARKLYGVVLFQQATQAVSDGRIEDAAKLFDEVERLGDFRGRVPADLRSRHTVIGARALLNRDLPAAREQFTELDKAADSTELRISAKLGLALTTWLEDQPGAARQVVMLLTECLRLQNPKDPLQHSWPQAPGDEVAAQLAQAAARRALPEAERDRLQTLRDLHLLRALALMRMWSEETSDPARAQKFIDACASRFACAAQIEPSFADPYLVVGLLRHHLAGSDPARQQAVTELRAAHMLGVREPQVLRILRDADRQKRSGDEYADLLDQIATTGTAVRATAGQAPGDRYGRVRNRDAVADAAATPETSPTVAELHDRAGLLAARVEGLAGALGTDYAAAAELSARLAAANAELERQARQVAECEATLLATIGGQLLPTDQEVRHDP